MKLRIETSSEEEEVVLRVPAVTPDVRHLHRVLSDALQGKADIALKDGETEAFVPINDLLFFEVEDGRVRAHTADRMYRCDSRLYELESMLPASFARAGKSCLVNTAHIISITRSLTGVSEVRFRGSNKMIFASRMYYKLIRAKSEETRLIK